MNTKNQFFYFPRKFRLKFKRRNFKKITRKFQLDIPQKKQKFRRNFTEIPEFSRNIRKLKT